MIKIGKKDVVISYISHIVSILSSIIVIPIILTKVSAEEYGLWSVFLSIQAFVNLFDMGFAKLVTRYSTYAYCGATSIEVQGLPAHGDDEAPNYILFFEVFYIAKKIYLKIALLALCIMSVSTIYILYLSYGVLNIKIVLYTWIIYSIGIVIQLYFTYYSSFVKGIGFVKKQQEISIKANIFSIFVKSILVFSGLGLLGLGIANFILVIYQRLALRNIFNNVKNGHELEMQQAKLMVEQGNAKQIYDAFFHNSKQLGGVVLSQYIQGQGTTLICSMLFSLEMTAKYSFSLQLFEVLVGIVKIPFQIFQPRLNELRLIEKMDELKDIYSVIKCSFWYIFSLGWLTIVLLAEPVLQLFGIENRILPHTLLIIMGIYEFVLVNHQRSTNIIGLGNEQPYAKAYIISSIVTLLIDALLLLIHGNVWLFLCCNLLIQLAYNAWRWPIMLKQELNLNNSEIIYRGNKKILSILRGTIKIGRK